MCVYSTDMTLFYIYTYVMEGSKLWDFFFQNNNEIKKIGFMSFIWFIIKY